MLVLNLITCALLAANVSARGVLRQLGFLNRYGEISKRIDSYAHKHGLSPSVRGDLWIKQKLDHFSPSSTEVYQQRYAMSKEYYVRSNSDLVFLMLEGESPMSAGWLQYSFMSEQAKKLKAAAFVLEHRFYGKSMPKGDLGIENLKYLSSEQALADAAHFIMQMNIDHGFKNPKWVVFGGSYAGSLAAWMRYRYPHLVHAAVSSSGPLFAEVDFPEYYQTVSKSLSTVSTKCVDAIRDAYRIMGDGIKNSTKREHYRQLFNLCEPLKDDKNDIYTFFEGIMTSFAYVVQYHQPSLSGSKNGLKSIDMKGACDIMLDDKTNKCPVHRHAAWVKEIFGNTCWEHRYSKVVEELKITKPHEHMILRQWLYQTCTEFGWYQTSSKKGETFGDQLRIDYYVDLCRDVYDKRFDASFLESSIQETNLNYGGISLDVSRVIFVHGTIDPWSSIGITKKPPKGSVSIFVKGVAHCADMFTENASDIPQLKKAKAKISRILGRWTSGKKMESEAESVFHFQ
ncbi:unnamed protein product [Bemisia tabaci]|uniref:Serine protease K12H4.7 n=3 Tax=Bemisia tabaci TaxID=7038 RepID=A0A9P0A8Y7_BEMTA|nr:unnamed protein product [Bemisia tabaci]